MLYLDLYFKFTELFIFKYSDMDTAQFQPQLIGVKRKGLHTIPTSIICGDQRKSR